MTGNFLKDFVEIIKNFSYDNTYKAAWAKALVEISLETEIDEGNTTHVIHLSQIAEKVLKYYWNQTIFFDLVQGSNLKKPPVILTLTKQLIDLYQSEHSTKMPIRYERVESLLKTKLLYKQTLKKTVTALKQDVSYRFKNLNKETYDYFYTYENKANSLTISNQNVKTLNDYAYMLFDIINYRWSLILESYNSSPRIGKKVKINDEDKIQRKPLKKYTDLLKLDNPDQVCFICGDPIKGKVALDHVIPWSYMYSDDLWNLVFVHPSCNSQKSNTIPSELVITKLEKRNMHLQEKLAHYQVNTKVVQELDLAMQDNLVRKFWIGCQ